jgi:hypothetical protein
LNRNHWNETLAAITNGFTLAANPPSAKKARQPLGRQAYGREGNYSGHTIAHGSGMISVGMRERRNTLFATPPRKLWPSPFRGLP